MGHTGTAAPVHIGVLLALCTVWGRYTEIVVIMPIINLVRGMPKVPVGIARRAGRLPLVEIPWRLAFKHCGSRGVSRTWTVVKWGVDLRRHVMGRGVHGEGPVVWGLPLEGNLGHARRVVCKVGGRVNPVLP